MFFAARYLDSEAPNNVTGEEKFSRGRLNVERHARFGGPERPGQRGFAGCPRRWRRGERGAVAARRRLRRAKVSALKHAVLTEEGSTVFRASQMHDEGPESWKGDP